MTQVEQENAIIELKNGLALLLKQADIWGWRMFDERRVQHLQAQATALYESSADVKAVAA